MRQVPEQPHYVIIGNGRVARHFAHYLSLMHVPFEQWSRSSKAKLTDFVTPSSIVMLLISDSAIEQMIRENDCLSDKLCIHFSACLKTELAYGAHPLMTFGEALYTLEDYQKIPWIIERGAPAFSCLFPVLPNPSFAIDQDQKAYYHALCVISNNFTTLLWQKFFNSMKEVFDIPSEHLLPFLERTLKNISADYKTALTGPLARNDSNTVTENLEALSDDAYGDVYRAFVSAYQQENKNENP